ncbi:MAG: DUF4432 family protein [SAR202 cluster bacterium]|nr:DUF4432 family protein [SAR202 cluster bacterium]|tara:strand:- start:987 stop:2069 length:1083 start_codon:yes stop_codon:yes gene_type:complete
MHYQDERTTGCRVSDSWSYRGIKTVIIENDLVRIIVLADKGADIYSFVHKPSDTDFMWHTPWGVRDPQKTVTPTGDPTSPWLDFYEGGWQTVVPHGGYPDQVYGADFGIHGDVNLIPWDAKIVEDSAELVKVTFSAKSLRSPIFVSKTLSLSARSSSLVVEECVTNQGEEDLDIVWLEHIAIGPPLLSDKSRLFVPESTVISHPISIDNNSKLLPKTSSKWPNINAKDGSVIDLSKIPPKEDRSLDMAYITDMKEGWYALLNEETGIGWAVTYPIEIFKYLWYWRNFGGGYGYPWYGRCYNAGLEPCTSFGNDGLKAAQQNGTALQIPAGQTVSAKITAGPFTGSGTVNQVDPQGKVRFQ